MESNLNLTLDHADKATRLQLFDEATARQHQRDQHAAKRTAAQPTPPAESPSTRGWTRDSLYTRGSSRLDLKTPQTDHQSTHSAE